MLLVVGNHQTVDVNLIPWEQLSGVMMVHCVEGGVFEMKHKLQVQCRIYNIPLYITFAVPPIENVPEQLLLGFGLTVSKEVMLYGQCNHTMQPG